MKADHMSKKAKINFFKSTTAVSSLFAAALTYNNSDAQAAQLTGDLAGYVDTDYADGIFTADRKSDSVRSIGIDGACYAMGADSDTLELLISKEPITIKAYDDGFCAKGADGEGDAEDALLSDYMLYEVEDAIFDGLRMNSDARSMRLVWKTKSGNTEEVCRDITSTLVPKYDFGATFDALMSISAYSDRECKVILAKEVLLEEEEVVEDAVDDTVDAGTDDSTDDATEDTTDETVNLDDPSVRDLTKYTEYDFNNDGINDLFIGTNLAGSGEMLVDNDGDGIPDSIIPLPFAPANDDVDEEETDDTTDDSVDDSTDDATDDTTDDSVDDSTDDTTDDTTDEGADDDMQEEEVDGDAIVDAGENEDGDVEITGEDDIGRTDNTVRAVKVGDACVMMEDGKIILGSDMNLTADSAIKMYGDKDCTELLSETTLGELLSREDRERLAGLVNITEDEDGNVTIGAKEEDLFSDKPTIQSVKVGDACKDLTDGKLANLGKREAMDAEAIVGLYTDEECSEDAKVGEAKLGELMGTVDQLTEDATVKGDYIDVMYNGDSLTVVRNNSNAKSLKLLGEDGAETCYDFSGKFKLEIPGGELFNISSAEVYEEDGCNGDAVESLDLRELEIVAPTLKAGGDNGVVADDKNSDKMAIKRKNDSVKSALLVGEDETKDMCVNFEEDSDIAYMSKTKLKQPVTGIEYYDDMDCRGNMIGEEDLTDLGVEPKEKPLGPVREGDNAVATYDAETDTLDIKRKNTNPDSVAALDENGEIIEDSCKNFEGGENVTMEGYADLGADSLRFFDANDCSGEELEDMDVKDIADSTDEAGCPVEVSADSIDELVKFDFDGNLLTATRLNSELVDSIKIGEKIFDFNGRIKLELPGYSDARDAEIIDCNGDSIPADGSNAPRQIEGDNADVTYDPIEDEVTVDGKNEDVKSVGGVDENDELIEDSCVNLDDGTSKAVIDGAAIAGKADKLRLFDGPDCTGNVIEDMPIDTLDVENQDVGECLAETDPEALDEMVKFDFDGNMLTATRLNSTQVESIKIGDDVFDFKGKIKLELPGYTDARGAEIIDCKGETVPLDDSDAPRQKEGDNADVTFKPDEKVIDVESKDDDVKSAAPVGEDGEVMEDRCVNLEEGSALAQIPVNGTMQDVETVRLFDGPDCTGNVLEDIPVEDLGIEADENDDLCTDEALAEFADKPDELVNFEFKDDMLVATRLNTDLVRAVKVKEETYSFDGRLKLELPGVTDEDDVEILDCNDEPISAKDLNDDGSVDEPVDDGTDDGTDDANAECPIPTPSDDPMNFVSFKFEPDGLRILRKDSCALCLDLGEHGKFSLAGKKDIFLDDVKSPKDVSQMKIYADEACTDLLSELGGEGEDSCPTEDLNVIRDNMGADQLVTFDTKNNVLIATRHDSVLVDSLRVGEETFSFDGKIKLELPGVTDDDDVEIMGCDGEPIATKDLNDDGSADKCPEDVEVPIDTSLADLVMYERDGDMLKLTRLDSKLVSGVKVGEETFDFTGNAKLEIPGYASKGDTGEILDCNGEPILPIPEEGACVPSGPVEGSMPEDFISYQIKDGKLMVKKEDDRAGGIELAGEKHMFEDGETALEVDNLDIDSLDSIGILNCDGEVISLFATGICSYNPTTEESSIVFEGDATDYMNYSYADGELTLYRVDPEADSMRIPGVVECMDLQFKKEIVVPVALEDVTKVELFDFKGCDTPIAEMTVSTANIEQATQEAGAAAIHKNTNDAADAEDDAAEVSPFATGNGAVKEDADNADDTDDTENAEGENETDAEDDAADSDEQTFGKTQEGMTDDAVEDSPFQTAAMALETAATDLSDSDADTDDLPTGEGSLAAQSGVEEDENIDVKEGNYADGTQADEDEEKESAVSEEIRNKNKDSDVKICIPNKTVDAKDAGDDAEDGSESSDGLVICTEFDPIDPRSPKNLGDGDEQGDDVEDGGHEDEDPNVDGEGNGSGDASDNGDAIDADKCETDENGNLLDPKCKETQGAEDGVDVTEAYDDYLSDEDEAVGRVDGELVTVGELRNKWSPLTINVTAPEESCANVAELAANSLHVRFEDKSGQRYVVPGYIKGAEGNPCSASWQARFTPPSAGEWTYRLYMKLESGAVESIDRTEDVLTVGDSRGEGFYSMGYVTGNKTASHILQVGALPGSEDANTELAYLFGTMLSSSAGDVTADKLGQIAENLAKTDANVIEVSLAQFMNEKMDLITTELEKLSVEADQMQQRQGAPVMLGLTLDGLATLSGEELDAYVEDMVARFAYLNGLLWIIPEGAGLEAIESIRSVDAHRNPIAVHAESAAKAGGADVILRGPADGTPHKGIVGWAKLEAGELEADLVNLELWSNLMMGLTGVEVIFDSADAIIERSGAVSAMVEASVYAGSFFQEYTDLSMIPVSACNGQCLIYGDVMVAYVEQGLPIEIADAELLELADDQPITWYDPIKRQMLQSASAVASGSIEMPDDLEDLDAAVAIVNLTGAFKKVEESTGADTKAKTVEKSTDADTKPKNEGIGFGETAGEDGKVKEVKDPTLEGNVDNNGNVELQQQ